MTTPVLDAERCLLGCIFLGCEWTEATAHVTPADFASEKHGAVFSAILSLSNDGLSVDRLAVKQRLQETGMLDSVGAECVDALEAQPPSLDGVARYAKLVRDASLLRRTVQACLSIATKARDASAPADKILDEAERVIMGLRAGSEVGSFVEMRELMQSTMARLELLSNTPGEIVGLPTGLTDLDALTCGIHAGQLVVLAARPKMGKSALALQWAAHAAIHAGKGAAIFSLEMTREEIGPRLLGNDARVDGLRLRHGKMLDSDWSKLALSAGRFVNAPLYLDDTLTTSHLEIRSKARRLHAKLAKTKTPLGLVVVDYLQLAGEFGDGREQEIAAIARSLKQMAKELQLPVIALSQLNRALEKRPDKRPMLSDLRESGSIEQDADLVVFIYRDEIYNPESDDKGIAELIIAAHRNGPPGTVKVTFQGEFMRFENISHGRQHWQEGAA